MIFTAFINEIRDRVQKRLGDSAEVKIRSVLKNNGVRFWGLIITQQEMNISPTIYLENFYEAYVRGISLDVIAESIVDSYQNVPQEMNVSMEFFRDFEKVKGRVAYRLVNLEKNKEFLADVPFIPHLDLAICFYYAFGDMKLGEGAILIQQNHMEMWNTDVKELFALAQENTAKLYPIEIMRMRTMMEQLLDGEELEGLEDLEPSTMYVLTNKKKIQGAAVILYPELLDNIARRLGVGFYIIPSSVHEVIVVPFHKEISVESMKGMIQEVNSTQVEPEDVLSDSLYAYDMKDKRIIKL